MQWFICLCADYILSANASEYFLLISPIFMHFLSYYSAVSVGVRLTDMLVPIIRIGYYYDTA